MIPRIFVRDANKVSYHRREIICWLTGIEAVAVGMAMVVAAAMMETMTSAA